MRNDLEFVKIREIGSIYETPADSGCLARRGKPPAACTAREGNEKSMKHWKRISIALAAASALMLVSCSSGPNAGVLVREAASGISGMKSCTASVNNTLVFTVNGTRHSFQTKNDLTFNASPFALKSALSSNSDGSSNSSVTYTMTENGAVGFYCKTATGWQKSQVQDLNPSPTSQISILQMLNNVEDEKYVRQTEIGSQKVHKIELKLKSEILRSTIENIVTVSGMGSGSKTVVQTLLDSAPTIYGYCYIGVDSGKIVRLDMDAADPVNQIFQGIDGSTVRIMVEKCGMSGDFSGIDATASVSLPQEARDASAVEAKG